MKLNTIALKTSLFALSLITLSSCEYRCIRGSGHITTDTKKVGDFTALDVSDAFKVVLHQDSSLNVAVSADDNLLKHVKLNVSGGKLRIYCNRSICSVKEMTVSIGVRQLNDIRISDGVELNTDGKLNVQDLKLKLSDGSRATIDVNASNLQTECSDASELHLSGQAGSHKLDIGDSGHLYAFDFVAGTYNVKASDASQSELNVLKTLKVRASDAAHIEYKGTVSDVNNNTSDAASVNKVN